MHAAIKRVLFYMILAATLYGAAMLFAEGQAAFVVIFGVGLLIGLAAEVIFWSHIFRLPWRRRKLKV